MGGDVEISAGQAFGAEDLDRFFRSLFEKGPDAILIARLDGTILGANPAACRMLGGTEDEIRRVGRAGLIVSDDRARRFLEEREKTGVAHGEILHRRADGSTFLVEATSAIIPAATGELYTYVVFRDVTEERRARDAAQRYELLAEHSRDVILFIRGTDGRIVDANAAACRVYGYSREDLLALSIRDLRAASTLDVLSGQMKAADASGVRFETFHRRQDGTSFPVEVISEGVDVRGARLLISVIRDASERKRVEAELARSEARFRAVFQNSRDALSVLEAVRDPEGRVVDWRIADANETALGVLGVPRDGFVGRTARELFADAAAELHGRWLGVLESGDPWTCEQTYRDRYLRVTVYRIDANSLSSSGVDVTEVRRAEQAARESEERFRTMADNIPQLAWMAEPNGDIFWFNRRWYDFTGTSLEAMRGWGWKTVHHADHVEAVIRNWSAGIASGSSWEDTFPLRHRDGAYRWFLTRAMPIKDDAGRVLRWFGTNTDVTEQREAAEKLAEADRRKSEFIGVLSHELRNPLTPIRNSLSILAKSPSDGPQTARAREVIERQTEHLTRLVDDLLDVNRISSAKIELRLERLDLRDVARRACDDHRSMFEDRKVELRFEAPAGPIWVDADATRIAQVTGNLLQNAARFSDPGSRTTVAAWREGDKACLGVRDTGIGMEPSDVPRMFEPFAQAENTLARTRGGLGLGLALVKGLVELHGGSVSGRSEGLARGSEFVVRLPFALAPRAHPRIETDGGTAARRSILIVEDNADAGETLKELLELGGHRVWLASDGRSAIALAREHRPQVVICDLGLPDISGYEVARVLREEGAPGDTRLVALSGYAQPEDKERAKAAGFDSHLAKPPSLDALTAAIAGDDEPAIV